MGNQFNKGFFEFIAAADAEKVHSQTIGWIFSNDCTVFDPNEKRAILHSLLNLSKNETIDLTPQKVEVEINDIDILITCADNNIIVIENKIKSSQHNNQLFKYEYLTASTKELAWQSFFKWKFPNEYNKIFSEVDGDCDKMYKTILEMQNKESFSKDFKWGLINQKKRPIYIYLTLIEEEPLGTDNTWKKVSYAKLLDVLSLNMSKMNTQNTENYWILKSYINTIQNLTKSINLFIQNPQDFKFVFTIGKQAIENIKQDELQDGKPQSYIKLLRLETLIQKWFYFKLVECINKTKHKLIKFIDINIGETHGTALLDFTFKEIAINVNKINFIPMLQFQGNRVKLAFAGSSQIEEFGIKEKSEQKSLGNDIKNVKNYFALKLSTNEYFKKLYSVKSTEEIISKISTPRKVNGFYSININKDNIYWQVENEKPIDFIMNHLELVYKIVKTINE